MKKKSVNIVVFLLLSFLCAPQWLQAQGVGDKFKSGKLYYRVTSATAAGVEVVPQNNNYPYWSGDEAPTGSVEIPAEVVHQGKTYAVTSIGERAFQDCNRLSSISIPKSIASIGGTAFRSCSSLTSIVVEAGNPNYSSQDGVLFNKDKSTLIQYPCGKAGEYSIPNSVTRIEERAFAYSSGLTAVTIPIKVMSIGSFAFYNCSRLEKIVSYIENVGAVRLGVDIFFKVPVATCKLFVPDVKVNDYGAAKQWKEFKNIRSQSTINEIGEGDKFKSGKLYYRVTSATAAEVEVVPQNNNYPYWSGDEAPTGAVEIPAEVVHQDKTYAVTSIGQYAFYKCSQLTSIEIPNSVTRIEEWAFAYSSGLTAVTIPNSVMSIGSSAFSFCSGLEKIVSYIENVGAVDLGRDIFFKVPVATCKLFVPDGKVNDYMAADQWKEFKNIRSLSTINEIGEGDKFKSGKLYYRVTSATAAEVEVVPQNYYFPQWSEEEAPTGSVEIPAEVVHQGKTYAVTSIGERAFQGCNRLSSISIPKSIASIGDAAFGNCTTLTTIVVEAGNPNYSSQDGVLFNKDKSTLIQYACGKAGEYSIPNSVTSIGQYAFWGCNRLTSITISKSVTSIVKSSFGGCSSLTSIEVEMGNPNYSSQEGVLFNKDKSTLIQYPCGKAGEYSLPSSVTSIEERAFAFSSGLTAVTIPNSVMSIGSLAFSFCSGLEKIVSYIENVGAVGLGGDIFDEVPVATCKLFVPNGKVNDYREADQWKEFKNIRPQSTINEIREGDKFKSGKLYYRVTSATAAEVEVVPQNNNYPYWSEEEAPTGSVEIPAEVVHQGKTHAVTSIGERAFQGCNRLSSISIPKSIASIGGTAFGHCTTLTTIVVEAGNPNYSSQDGVLFNKDKSTLIQYPCGKAGEYSIPNSVTSIGQSAFWGCNRLSSISIPKSIASIVKSSFGGCSSLTSIEVEMGNPNYSSQEGVLFNKDKSTLIQYPCGKAGEYSLPNSVTRIEERAFAFSRSLSAVTIPNSVMSIGSSAFSYCSGLEKIVSNIEDVGAVGLGEKVFEDVPVATCTLFVPEGTVNDYRAADQWKEFKNIRSLSTINEIGEGDKFKSGKLYYRVTSATAAEVEVVPQNNNYPYWSGEEAPTGSVEIPAEVVHQGKTYAVTSIGERAFWGCNRLSSISIPKSIASIGDAAFGHCTTLTTIVVEAGNPNYSSQDGVLFNKDKSTLIQYPCGKAGEYSIPNSVTSIGQSAFWGCNRLTSISIPKSIASIVKSSFGGCSSLTSIEVEMGNPNYSSQEGVLFNRDKSTLIQYPCGKPGEYSIPNSVTRIEERAFASSSGLTAVTIPNSVMSIGSSAFSYCSGLEKIVSNIEDVGAVGLGEKVFEDVPVATCTLFVPEGKVNAYRAADQWKEFKNIRSLSTINEIGEGDKFKSGKLYYRVTSTTPAEVEVVPQNNNYPYWSKDEVPTGSVEIPAEVVHQGKTYAVTSIGERAFQGCNRLSSISIPKSIASIGGTAFGKCTTLTTIVVEAGNPNYSSQEGVLFNKDKSTLIQYPCGKAGEYSIPSSVTRIEEWAFAYSSGLTAVTIPNSVMSIGSSAFSYCSGLEKIVSNIEDVGAVGLGEKVFEDVPVATCKLFVPDGTVNDYRAADQWKEFKNITSTVPTPPAPTPAPDPDLDPDSPSTPDSTTSAVASAPEPLRIHPNPTAGGINLEAQGEVRVFSSLGQLVLTVKADGSTRIELGHLPAGIYIVRTGAQVTKVLKR